jgi:hypothetical protein
MSKVLYFPTFYDYDETNSIFHRRDFNSETFYNNSGGAIIPTLDKDDPMGEITIEVPEGIPHTSRRSRKED